MLTDAGMLLYRCRKIRGITQRELATRTGVSKATLSNYENGRFEPKWAYMMWCLDAMGFELELKEKKK